MFYVKMFIKHVNRVIIVPYNVYLFNNNCICVYLRRDLLRRRDMYIYRCRQEVENSLCRDRQYLYGIDRG